MIKKEKILLVEDEKDVRDLLVFQLTQAGYLVDGAESGEKGLEKLEEKTYDLLVLDLMLPGIDGVEVCRRLKAKPVTRNLPVIMLTAKGEENDVVTGLDSGADDYVRKPFSIKVLVARIRAVLRRPVQQRADTSAGPVLTLKDMVLDPARHKVEIRGRDIGLTHTEFRILQLLASHPGEAFSRQRMVDHIRGEAYAVTERIIDVQMVSLRKKMGSYGRWIETVRSVGYRIREI